MRKMTRAASSRQQNLPATDAESLQDFLSSARQVWCKAHHDVARDQRRAFLHDQVSTESLERRADFIHQQDLGTMGFHRRKGERDFSDREKDIFNLLLPHVARAFHRLDLMQGRIPSTGVGEIVLGTNGEPLSMNEEAKHLLNGHAPQSVPDPGLCAASTYFSTHTGIFRVRTLPHRPTMKSRTMLLERLPPQQLLQSKLSVTGLTRRQAEVAVFAIQGFSNREIADRLFITEQTVKDHLHDVFNHLKITRRGELTATFLGLCPGDAIRQ